MYLMESRRNPLMVSAYSMLSLVRREIDSDPIIDNDLLALATLLAPSACLARFRVAFSPHEKGSALTNHGIT